MLKYVTNAVLRKSIVSEFRIHTRKTMSAGQDCVEVVVCKESDIPENGMKEFKLDEKAKVLIVKQDGNIYALGTKCSHYGAPLATSGLAKGIVRCPWHGACFDLKTGDIEDGPGLDSIPCYNVSVSKNGDVKVNASRSLLEANIRVKAMSKRNPRSQETFVIIGGGGSGSSCAEVLRQEKFDGRLIVLSKDKYLPYDRPKVSKMLDSDFSKIGLRKQEFYDKSDIEYMLNEEVTELDTTKKVVRTASGKEIPYTKVFVACGVDARRPSFFPGHELENIFTIRNLEDSEKIMAALNPEKKLVVVGSSFIGMEAAAFCFGKVASVTVVGRSEVPFQDSLGKVVGGAIGKFFESKGVKIMNKANFEKFVGENNKLTGVVVNGETIPADLCIVGLGSTYETQFLKKSDLKLRDNGAIEVDEYLQTSNPDIFAGGDVAYAPIYGSGGEKNNIGHWQLAQYHGKRAALSMLGRKRSIKSVPYFYSMLFGAGLRYAGYGKYDDVVVVGDLDAMAFVAYYCRGSEVIAAASIKSDPIVAKFSNLLLDGKKLHKDDLVDNKWVTAQA